MSILDRLASLRRHPEPAPVIERQGAHVDPGERDAPAPVRVGWPALALEALNTPEAELFRRNLTIGELDVRASVIDDLATFHGIEADEVLRRCRDWESDSVTEWQAEDRDDPEGLLRFYRTTQSWSFDLLWYAYLQSVGYHVPTSVVLLRWLREHAGPGRRHLDFGSGCGATGQLFSAAGWRTTLGDVSSTLLDFARFRLERRHQHVRYLDLATEELPAGGFDVITAIDALAHVPDIEETARALHTALAPGGLLLANIDARPSTPENAWHLYDDERSARYRLQRAGFLPVGHAVVTIYRKVDPTSARQRVRSELDRIMLDSRAGRAAASIRRAALGR